MRDSLRAFVCSRYDCNQCIANLFLDTESRDAVCGGGLRNVKQAEECSGGA